MSIPLSYLNLGTREAYFEPPGTREALLELRSNGERIVRWQEIVSPSHLLEPFGTRASALETARRAPGTEPQAPWNAAGFWPALQRIHLHFIQRIHIQQEIPQTHRYDAFVIAVNQLIFTHYNHLFERVISLGQ